MYCMWSWAQSHSGARGGQGVMGGHGGQGVTGRVWWGLHPLVWGYLSWIYIGSAGVMGTRIDSAQKEGRGGVITGSHTCSTSSWSSPGQQGCTVVVAKSAANVRIGVHYKNPQGTRTCSGHYEEIVMRLEIIMHLYSQTCSPAMQKCTCKMQLLRVQKEKHCFARKMFYDENVCRGYIYSWLKSS